MGSPLNLTRQDEKRLKILAAAEETFLEKGFHACHFLKSVDYLDRKSTRQNSSHW